MPDKISLRPNQPITNQEIANALANSIERSIKRNHTIVRVTAEPAAHGICVTRTVIDCEFHDRHCRCAACVETAWNNEIEVKNA